MTLLRTMYLPASPCLAMLVAMDVLTIPPLPPAQASILLLTRT